MWKYAGTWNCQGWEWWGMSLSVNKPTVTQTEVGLLLSPPSIRGQCSAQDRICASKKAALYGRWGCGLLPEQRSGMLHGSRAVLEVWGTAAGVLQCRVRSRPRSVCSHCSFCSLSVGWNANSFPLHVSPAFPSQLKY